MEAEEGKSGEHNQPISKQISGGGARTVTTEERLFFILASNTVTNQNL